MSLFSAIVKTTINVATLPVAVVKDIVTMGGVANGRDETYTKEKLEQIKRESESKE
jgi:hypothetical protein